MKAPDLHYDKCRCQGRDCDRKADCLRFAALDDMGPATPWTERYCHEIGRESEGFLAIREEVK